MARRLITTRRLCTAATLLVAACTSATALAEPAGPTPIMPLNEVRVGMKGYGLTVFAGKTIEPFAVEVVSVMHDFRPRQGVIWILCPDQRMQHSGPVQGMSGSPIYLWDEALDQQPGKGGRLIGAFAWGYPLLKTCYAGVTPIESMRQVGQRAGLGQPQEEAATAGANLPMLLRSVLEAARAEGLNRSGTWRAEALAELIGNRNVRPPAPAYAPPRPPLPGLVQRHDARVTPMLLPVPVATGRLSRFLAPFLEPMGMTPVSAGAVTGKPPPNVKPEEIRLEPGGVLAIPMLWGDMDLNASGTCTEVLPDGRVLAFGHAMFGQGHAALPMATGYVHFIMPVLTTSFKLSGSAVVQRGAIVRDEQSAVVGSPDGRFRTAAMRVQVTMPDQEVSAYRYTLAHHRLLTPVLAAVGAMRSVSAEQSVPIENTMRVRATLRFGHGRDLKINSLIPGGSDLSAALQLMAPLAVMANNPFEPLMVEDVDVTTDIEPVVRSALLMHARADRVEYAPGQTVAITVTYQPYRKPPAERRIHFQLPQRLPDGTYTITIASGPDYFQQLLRHRPHLAYTDKVDDIVDLIAQILAVEDDALYLTMQVPGAGLAIRRHELPKLPSSRRALISSPTGIAATPFVDWVVKKVDLGLVPEGDGSLQIEIRKDLQR